jgi:hypothetical protein
VKMTGGDWFLLGFVIVVGMVGLALLRWAP